MSGARAGRSGPGWDPDRYLVYADERGRPFTDLLHRVDVAAPARVVDLGCGPGNLTALLAARWPDADVVGVDSSPEMVERARAGGVDGVRFTLGDVRTWPADAPAGGVDVLTANATFHRRPGTSTRPPPPWTPFRHPGGSPSQCPANTT